MNSLQPKNQKTKVKTLVVAESGLLTDICLRQNAHSVYICDQAKREELALAIPEYAFSEVDGQLHQRLSNRLSQIQQIRRFTNELLREQDMAASAGQLREILATVEEQTASKQHLIQAELSAIAEVCQIIPITFESFRRGKLRFLRSTPPPDENDCHILECVLCYLAEHQNDYELKIFLCHDQRHFDDSTLHESLAQLNAQMVFSSSACLQTIRSYLPDE